MGYVFTKGEKIHGVNASAAAAVATDFPIFQQSLRGADIASAAIVTPGIEDYFHVTGATRVNFIGTTNLLPGRKFLLYFPSSLVLGNNAASPPGGTVPMQLLAGADTTTGAGGKAWFVYDDAVGAAIQVAGVGPGAAVASVSAGPGISITGTSTNPIINNTVVLSVSSGPGISITGTGANPIVNNTGVLSATAGTNVTISGTAQNPVINVTGVVTSVRAGTGISITGTATSPIVNNTGVLAILAGPGINVPGGGGGPNPTVSAKILGTFQFGGVLDGAGSLSQWFPGGHATLPSSDPMEYSIDQCVLAGATTMRYVGLMNAITSGGGTNIYLTGATVPIAGTIFSYSSSSAGSVTDVTVAIPAPYVAGPRAGYRAIGLGIFGNGAFNLNYTATVTLS